VENLRRAGEKAIGKNLVGGANQGNNLTEEFEKGKKTLGGGKGITRGKRILIRGKGQTLKTERRCREQEKKDATKALSKLHQGEG